MNGLQTSYEVNRWARSGGIDTNRLLMIRIIETTDEDVINSVIKATNYQTKVKPHSLRATEEIHRQIEIQLYPHNVFYDRRRNYYKNLNKPASRTIGIDRMAQAVTAMLLEKPDVARARPTSLMKDSFYAELFPSGPTHPLKLYHVAAEAMFVVSAQMNASEYERIYKNNLRFHVLTALSWWLAGSVNPTAAQIAAITVSTITNALSTTLPSGLSNSLTSRRRQTLRPRTLRFRPPLRPLGRPSSHRRRLRVPPPTDPRFARTRQTVTP